jgi:hypothetical protein
MSLDIWLEVKVDTGGREPHKVELFSDNITHNLNTMAEEAGIYNCLWHPYVLWENPTAGDLIAPLEEGLRKLKSHPEHYEKFNSPNGWGTYRHFVPFVERVLSACREHPKASVATSV